jgi:hypothetical protein
MAPRVHIALASVALTALVAAAVLALVAAHGSAQIVPEVKVELDTGQESQVATVTDLVGDPDITFKGTITVTRPFPINPVTVTPDAFVENVDARWKVTPNPSKLTFNGSGSQPFTIVVSAPANLSAGATFTVTFNATATGLLYYNTVPSTGYIGVLQYFKLGQFSSSEVIHIKQGDSRTLNFTVQNRGNGADTVDIVLGNEAKISFILTTEIDATPGDVKFNFTLKSSGSGERVTSSVDFSLVVEKAILKSFIYKYWWTIVVGVALLVVIGALVIRRRGRRRDDEDALAQMQVAGPAKKAAPPRRRAGPRAPPKKSGDGEWPGRPQEGDDAMGDDGAEADGSVEVTVDND